MKRILFFIAFPVAVLIGIGFWSIFQNSTRVENEIFENIESRQETQEKIIENSQKEASFQNISFVYDTSLFADAEGKTIEASPIPEPDLILKPEGVFPKHISFVFKETYNGKAVSGDDYSPPRLHIYPVKDYKKAYLFYEINLDSKFKNLKKILAGNSKIAPSSGERQLPYIPFADASQIFQAHAQILNFKNGKGLLFLTQWTQDATPINNDNLKYIFQGLTNDNKYFVLIEFPVSTEGLPKDVYAKYPEKYRKLDDDSATYWKPEYQKLYNEYAFETAIMLNEMPSNEFTPNLDNIKDLIGSLKVK